MGFQKSAIRIYNSDQVRECAIISGFHIHIIINRPFQMVFMTKDPASHSLAQNQPKSDSQNIRTLHFLRRIPWRKIGYYVLWFSGISYTCYNIIEHFTTYRTYPSIITQDSFDSTIGSYLFIGKATG